MCIHVHVCIYWFLDPVNFYPFCVYVHMYIHVHTCTCIYVHVAIQSANVRLHVLVSLLLKLLHYQDVGIHLLLAATKQRVTVTQVDPAYIHTSMDHAAG